MTRCRPLSPSKACGQFSSVHRLQRRTSKKCRSIGLRPEKLQLIRCELYHVTSVFGVWECCLVLQQQRLKAFHQILRRPSASSVSRRFEQCAGHDIHHHPMHHHIYDPCDDDDDDADDNSVASAGRLFSESLLPLVTSDFEPTPLHSCGVSALFPSSQGRRTARKDAPGF